MKKQLNEKQFFNAPIQGLDDEKYRGEWLIIEASTGKIMVHEKTLPAAQKEAKRIGVEHPAIYRVPSFSREWVLVK